MHALQLNLGAALAFQAMGVAGGDPLLDGGHVGSTHLEVPDTYSEVTDYLSAAGKWSPLQSESQWYLARMLSFEGEDLQALRALVAFGNARPEDPGLPEALARLYDRLSTVHFDDTHADWTNVPYTVIRPHESRSVQLQLPRLQPRVVRLRYHDYLGKVLIISVEGVLLAEIEGQGLGWQTYEVGVPPVVGDIVALSLTNPTDAAEVAVSWLSLQYLPSVRFFDDMEAAWSDKPFKPLAPGESYRGELFLRADKPRSLKMEYYEYPQHNVAVTIGGVDVGHAHSSIGGWREVAWPVPSRVGDVVHVTLMNAHLQGSALIRRVQLVYKR